ncbi:MAG: nucleotidyl transferase AbiEii/AbiGii toxin family protein [Acidimicrobiaceae bacterium]|nr:nucleotidyl transferase AbiEii/AbiGii toxin family protein [Acidimicrobiaceae bacterium]
MRYADPEAFRAALEDRLRPVSTGAQDLSRRRRIVAFDRLLARLAVADHQAWILKGGAALEFRMPEQARSTRDIDLALASDLESADRLLQDLEGDPFGDYFSFRVTRRRELSDLPDRGLVVRLSLKALLGSRVFEHFVVDVVGGERMPATVERVELGRGLGFADLPVVEMAVIDLRTHWAEKLSAYLRRYDDRPNTRVKDLVDLVLLVEHDLEPDDRLRVAVEETFARRSQHLPLSELPSMADSWALPYAEMASDLGLTTVAASDAHDLIESFWRRAQSAGPSTAGGIQLPTT